MNRNLCRIEEVKNYLHKNYSEKIDLRILADIANLSVYHFSRLFLNYIGISPMKYLKNYRLDKSVYLLKNSNLNISEIAYSCGFSSISSFNTLFKQRYKKSPKMFFKLNNSKKQIKMRNNQEDLLICNSHNLNKSFLRRIWDMNIIVKDLPEYKIAYCRHVGSYLDTSENWKKLLHWVSKNDLFKTEPLFIGISQDDPEITEEDACRHDACVTLPENFSFPESEEIFYDKIVEGKYVVYSFYDTVDKLAIAYRSLFNEYLPQSGFEVDCRPCLEINLNNPADDPENKSKTDICIPIKV